MGPSDLEYVGLRLVRRFLFRPGLLRLFEPFLPYYRVSVNEDTPDSIVERYARHCRTRGIDLAGRTVLEIGVGATNGTGYELAARGVKSWCGFEPHAAYQRKLDQAILEKAQHRLLSETWRAAVRRVAALSEVPDGSIDLVLSHSVLEHVSDPHLLFRTIAPKLAEKAEMIHIVDYRDHFFKYPHHFLLFGNRTWRRFLDPGDLPRHRFSDHADSLRNIGCSVDLFENTVDEAGFGRIRNRIHAEFRRYPQRDLAMTGAVIYARKEQP